MQVRIRQVDENADGIASWEGETLVVPGAAVGDHLEVKVVHTSNHRPVSWCEIVRVLSRGPDFRAPPCPHAAPLNGRCGGCPAMHLSLKAQGEMKVSAVRKALSTLDNPPHVTWTSPASHVGYRSRGQFVANEKKGWLLLGSYAPRSHDVVSMEGCRVQRPGIGEAAQKVCELFSREKIAIHPEKTGLRYVTIRASRSGECLVDLVFNGRPDDIALGTAKDLCSSSEIHGVSWSCNDSAGNAIRTQASVHITGRETVVEKVGEIDLEMEASSFFQLNTETASAMYTEAASILRSGRQILDLYCGVGGLGITAARALGAKLFGAESVESAVRLAVKNARLARVDATFVQADLSTTVPFSDLRPDAVAVNPPRRGLDEPVLRYLEQTTASVIAYMSCNPKSFARDTARLERAGWTLATVSAHDMLPGTAHVEVMGGLRR